MREKALDMIDYNILMILMQNCRTSYSVIANKLNLSIVSIQKRIRKLLAKKKFFFRAWSQS